MVEPNDPIFLTSLVIGAGIVSSIITYIIQRSRVSFDQRHLRLTIKEKIAEAMQTMRLAIENGCYLLYERSLLTDDDELLDKLDEYNITVEDRNKFGSIFESLIYLHFNNIEDILLLEKFRENLIDISKKFKEKTEVDITEDDSYTEYKNILKGISNLFVQMSAHLRNSELYL